MVDPLYGTANCLRYNQEQKERDLVICQLILNCLHSKRSNLLIYSVANCEEP